MPTPFRLLVAGLWPHMAARWPLDAAGSRGTIPAVIDYGALTLRDWLSYLAARWRARRTQRRARRRG